MAPSSSGTLLAFVPESSRPHASAAAREVGMEPVLPESLGTFLAALGKGDHAATLLSLPGEETDEALARRVSGTPGCGILLLSSASVSMERALLMERVGAVALLREPLDPELLARRLLSAAREGAEVPVPSLPAQEPEGATLVGSSPAMAHVFETVARVAGTPSTVLLTGESGTGKEVVARILHQAGGRGDGPFVAVNCAAIPEHLLESELFGHERGAFTGAVERRTGRFQRARGGTLFLDEIGDMSLVLQAKILRALEERAVEPVGGSGPVPVDVRVVAATNRELQARIEAGEFREDLYFRLAVVELPLPALRERDGDVRELALHFCALHARRYDREIRAVTEEALRRLEEYRWPGNVRELRNVMDRAVLLTPGPVVGSSSLRLGAASPRISPPGEAREGRGYSPELSLAEVEADHIRRVLAACDGHMSRAAEILGIHRNTLTRKVQDYGVEVPAPGGDA